MSLSISSPALSAPLPTNYEYYTSGGIKSGLSVDQSYFTLNERNVSLYSGALHYFRIPRAYWRDRMRKLRAAGFNTVETYVSWNLHEPRSGEYDFGDGNNDMSDFLHLQEFLKTAQEKDLFAIVRSGPYISAEFEFGGHPSWLLRDKDLEMRTSNAAYMKYVTRFFNVLLPLLAALQFTKGGPIVMFQVENEYSVSGKHDLKYLEQLRQLMLNNGINELLVTADNPWHGTYGTLPDLFYMTGNFHNDPKKNLDDLKALQPNKPQMAMEFWSGWFDNWGGSRSDDSLEDFKTIFETLLSYPASVNIYMFQGGTNFGFLNGATNTAYDDLETDYYAVTTSYDYEALLDESGDYTEKYWAAKELLEKYNPLKTALPAPPPAPEKKAYSTITVQKELSIGETFANIQSVQSENVIAMENLDINNKSGQSFGYIVYRKTLDIPAGAVLKIEGRVCDTVIVLINGALYSPWISGVADLNKFGTTKVLNGTLPLSDTELKGATLDLIVENWGRVNVGVYKQFKGLWQGGVLINDQYLTDWTIFPLEFKKPWTNSLTFQTPFDKSTAGPVLYQGTLNIEGAPKDTFVDMQDWRKGIVIVNGFVIGRYARMGPIQTLFLPAPFLKEGDNSIVVFEHYKTDKGEIRFNTKHVYASN